MELNSYMSYIQKIILLAVCTSLGAEMLPENGSVMNYTQVFFRWDQIPNAESYQFTIQKMNIEEELELNLLNGIPLIPGSSAVFSPIAILLSALRYIV